MSSALRELIAFFGVEVDDKKLDHAGEKMEGLAKLAEQVGATIGLAFGLHEIGEFIKGQVELGAELLHTSEILGLGVEELQAFQYAAVNAGLGADEANTALRFLNKNLGEAATKGGDGAAAFAKLGVKIKDANGQTRPTQDILGEVADGISKLPGPAEKTAKAMEIFGRAGARMIPLLNKGSKGIAEFYDEFEKLGGGISKDFAEQAEEGEHQMNKLNLVMKAGKSIIAAALLPAFGWVVERAVELVTWFRELSKHSFIVQTALGTLAAIVGVLAIVWAALNFEVLLVLLALALVVLVVDDIYTAFMGGKSVIGDFIDSLLGAGATVQVVDAIKQVASELWTELLAVWDATKSVIGAFSGVADQSAPTKTGLQTVLDVIHGIGEAARATNTAVLTLLGILTTVGNKYAELKKDHPAIYAALAKTGNNGAADIDAAQGAGRAVGGVGARLVAPFKGILGDDEGPTHAAPTGLLGALGFGGATQHITNNNQIDVKGGPSNADTGKAVAKGLEEREHLQASYAAVPGNGGS